MSNMRVWDAVKRPPATALREIAAGRLKGKSDINPQWRYEALTALYGPCGSGWYYTVDRCWTEAGLHNNGAEVAAFAQISLYVLDGDTWSQPITGVGGSMLIAQEKNGPYTSDEAFKMATTDAISVACKCLGLGADVYYGRWDGSKYRDGMPAIAAPYVQSDDSFKAEAGLMELLDPSNNPDIVAMVGSSDFRDRMQGLKALDESAYTRVRQVAAKYVVRK